MSYKSEKDLSLQSEHLPELIIPGLESVDWSMLNSLGVDFNPASLLGQNGQLDEAKVEEFLQVIDSLLDKIDQLEEETSKMEIQIAEEVSLLTTEQGEVAKLLGEYEGDLPEIQVKLAKEVELNIDPKTLIDKV